MEIRFQQSPKETQQMTTQQLRDNYLVQNLMQDDKATLVYTHHDRVIIGGVKPVSQKVALPNHSELKAEYFLERRELGIINVGGDGVVIADGTEYKMTRLDCVYLGKGTKEVTFQSTDAKNPAILYLLSTPAHKTYPNAHFTKEQAVPVKMGDVATCNVRTINKYIFAQGIQSCQLVMGLTLLETGSVWNTMPAHVHTRRMEAYFYFDVPSNHRVIHFMGEPQETRHMFVANHEAIISPAWSIHSGCATHNYGFIWGMGGENFDYTDQDFIPVEELR